MKKLILILFIFPFFTKANTVIIGSGSGSVSRTSMGALNSGDTLAITAGTYSGGIQLGAALHDITVINYGGTVISTATMDMGAGSGSVMQNVRVSGTGSGATYGFVFDATGTYGGGQVGFTSNDGVYFTSQNYIGIRFDHIWFKSIPNNCFNLQGAIPLYNGTTASFALYKATFSYCRADNVSQFYQGNYQSGSKGMADSIDMSFNIINQTSGNGLLINSEMTDFNIHDNQILYPSYNSQVGDVGAISLVGFGQIHHNYMKGGRGYLDRIVACCFKSGAIQTLYEYDNIKIATSNYGMCDNRADSAYFSGISSYFQHANFQIVNNTIGNASSWDNGGAGPTNNYVTPVALFYHMDNGATAVVKNNLAFNNVGTSPTNVVVSFATDYNGNPLGFTQIDTADNRYFTAATILNALSDTTAQLAVKTGSVLIGQGLNFANVPTDFVYYNFANPRSIGAREYQTSHTPPTASPGSNQTITLPTSSVSLTGSGTAFDGATISTYSWSKVSGGTATITSPTSQNTTVTGLVAGTYIFSLTVTDNLGSSSTPSNVTIFVNPAVSACPNCVVANPGGRLYGSHIFKGFH